MFFRVKVIFYVVVLAIFCGGGEALALYERDIAKPWCDEMKGISQRLKGGTEVDCVTDAVAYEIDFAKKWAEGLGQALFYSSETKRKAGVALILRSAAEVRFVDRLKQAIEYHGLDVSVELILLYEEES